MDSKGHLASAKGHITSTLIGDMNRNGWQQLKAGRLGGPDYDGGHAGPSALGFIGERGGLFPQHEWQNRKFGPENDEYSFADTERDVIKRVKADQMAGREVDLHWSMSLQGGTTTPSNFRLRFSFGEEMLFVRTFSNVSYEK